MKKILLILDGMLSKHFLERVAQSATSENVFHVVYYNDNILPKTKSDHTTYFKFDPTSFSKLSLLDHDDYIQVLVILATKSDTVTVIKHLNKIHSVTPISVLNKWDIDTKEFSLKNLKLMNSNNFLTNRMIDQLPHIPSTAQNIGLGIGEVMEVRVPFSSSYVYRHIASIEQKNYRIVGIYRDSKLIIAEKHHVIQPNDSLLIIGDPKVLKNVYTSIKNELGQFPAPFGSRIYLYIDASIHTISTILNMINSAIYFHENSNSKSLFIRVVNPSTTDKLDMIKEYDADDIQVDILYENNIKLEDILQKDVLRYNVGLIVVDKLVFSEKKNLAMLYNINIPTLKVGSLPIIDAQDIILFLNGYYLELISSIVYDLSSQLKLNIKLFDYEPDGSYRVETIEHYQNLSKIFSKKIEVFTEEKNPIREAKKFDNFLQIIPFSEDILKSTSFSKFFSTNSEILVQELQEYNQLFIPTGK